MVNRMPSSRGRRGLIPFSRLLPVAVLICAFISVCSGQVTIATGRSDNQRSGANTNETILTPANVNSNQFGYLFNYAIDYQALAQPLYVPNVTINGVSHNVVFVATMADSVYAFDADSNTGGNAQPLWSVNFTNPANGITLATGATLPCSGTGVGFTQEGIAGTPAIDTTTGTLYLVAKTVDNGTVHHRLHALDITSGAEKFGGPVLINASTTYLSPLTGKTYTTTFNSLHQLNRPGLLLQNGTVYIAFGSNSCNDGNTGWVLSYNAASLSQMAVFNTSPQHGLVSIWQSGNGIAADESGNIFVETGESCVTCYDVNVGGATYANSIVELDPNTLDVTQFFTPYDVAFLNKNDEDLSSTGVLVLPDIQGGTTPHELVAGGKQGFVYVLNRDDMGSYNGATCTSGPTCDNVLEEFGVIPGELPTKARDVLFSSPVYWNNTVYFAPNASPVLAYPVSNGSVPLGTPLTTTQKLVGAHSPSISANGNTNGVLWVMSGGNLDAFNATTMQEIYSSTQVKTRDDLPPIAHFATQTVANGKVYIATQTTLHAYGLLPTVGIISGGSQSGQAFTALPSPIQLQVYEPYSGVGVAGVTVTFSDGGKKGVFNPPSAVSDSNGYVSTVYTLPKIAATYTLTATLPSTVKVSFTETAVPGPAKTLVVYSGNKQTGQAGSILPLQLRAQIRDAYGNGIPGHTITFSDSSGSGTLTPNGGVSNSSGQVTVSYQLPNADGTYKILAGTAGLNGSAQFLEYASGYAPASIGVVSGSNQAEPINTALPQPVVVQVTDQVGNPIAGVAVTFSAPSGTFSANPVATGANGEASVQFMTGPVPGPLTITAAVNALKTHIAEEVSGAGAPASVTVSGGNNQTGSVGSTLSQLLSVVVMDNYGNGVPGVGVYFNDDGAGGTFSNPNPAVTNGSGIASVSYTLPTFLGTVHIAAAATGVNNPATFFETAVSGPAAVIYVRGGNNQSGPVGTLLTQALTTQVTDQYGNPVSGVNVSFTDNGAGGTFAYANPVATNSSGIATQQYTLPLEPASITIYATASGVSSPAAFSETAVAGPVGQIFVTGGDNQSGPDQTQLLQTLSALVTDQYGNPVSGVNVSFNDSGAGGVFSNPNPVTNSSGIATEMYTLPPATETVYINASATGTGQTLFRENSGNGPMGYTYATTGNDQFAAAGTQLPQTLTVVVTDQFGNPAPGASVTFSDGGAGGVFSNPNPVIADGTGTATQTYTLPANPGAVTISASANGNPAVFIENSVSGPAFYILVTSGNGQSAPAGTQLPQTLTVLATDQNGNPSSALSVTFSDGGAGGTFSNPNPVATNNSGIATEMYTLPPNSGAVTIYASASGVTTPASFSETGQ